MKYMQRMFSKKETRRESSSCTVVKSENLLVLLNAAVMNLNS
jgi:hypothetical protein